MKGGVEVLKLRLKQFEPEVARREHIRIAREGIAKHVSKMKEKVPYGIIVDGRPANSEEEVKPFGVIKYVFIKMSVVGKLAIKTARDLSPVESGRYKKSWMLIADQVLVDETGIPEGVRELILVNNQPYARKIHLRGARIRNVPPGIVEKVRQLVLRKFRNMVTVDLRFIELRGAYVLRHDYVQTRAGGRRRVHTKAGRQLTYPALVIRPKFV